MKDQVQAMLEKCLSTVLIMSVMRRLLRQCAFDNTGLCSCTRKHCHIAPRTDQDFPRSLATHEQRYYILRYHSVTSFIPCAHENLSNLPRSIFSCFPPHGKNTAATTKLVKIDVNNARTCALCAIGNEVGCPLCGKLGYGC